MTPLPYTLAPADTVEHATALLREKGVRHLPVVDAGRVVGLISERDLFVASRFANTHGMKVEILMEPEPYTVTRDTSLREVARTMEKQALRRRHRGRRRHPRRCLHRRGWSPHDLRAAVDLAAGHPRPDHSGRAARVVGLAPVTCLIESHSSCFWYVGLCTPRSLPRATRR